MNALEEKIASLCQQTFMPFSAWMQQALYDPDHGYYSLGKNHAHRDYTTAPRISNAFGYALFQVLIEQSQTIQRSCRNDTRNIIWVEWASGEGSLAKSLFEWAQTIDTPSLSIHYYCLESHPRLAENLKHSLADFPNIPHRWQWHIGEMPPPHMRGIIFANELFDALPCEVIQWDDRGIWQQGVGYEKARGFYPKLRPITEPSDLASLIAQLPPTQTTDQGYRVRCDFPNPYVHEINLQAPLLLKKLLTHLACGYLITFDYGDSTNALYRPERSGGTLKAIAQHQHNASIYQKIGEQDLTADVDFSVLAQAGASAGATLIGYTSQAHFIINAGIEGWMNTLPKDSLARAQALAGFQQLINPAMMGEAIKVIAWRRGIDDNHSCLRGFAQGDRQYQLNINALTPE